MLLLAVMTVTGMAVGAKSLAPGVTSIELYGSPNWDEPMAQFTMVGEDEWKLSDITINGGTEFKLKLHFSFTGNEWDEWWGSSTGEIETLKSAAPGTIVECDNGSNSPNLYIGHTGEFTFTMSFDDIDQMRFGFEGNFEPARFLKGDFNNWEEIQFIAWVGDYTLDLNIEGITMSGQFLIVDQDYNEYGAVTDEDYYTITEDNPTLNLATETQSKKNLYLANESSYFFSVDDNNVLTVGSWPVEVVTVSLVGSTQQGWDKSNATFIPLTQDDLTGYYTVANKPIPAGFNCQVLKHSSLSSVEDVWYGGTTGNGNIEIPDGGDDYDLIPTLGDTFTFTDNGKFTISVAPDFSEAKIYGIYTSASEFFLIGDFNNWNPDEKVAFTHNDGVATLIHTFSGEFLIMDEYGNLLGASTAEDHYWLHEGWPSVMLVTDRQVANKKNIYIKDESEYTLTISNGELTVSGWPVETISAWLLGATDNQWEGNELNFELTKDSATGNYVLAETDIPAGYRFQVVKRSSLSSVADVWFGASADDDKFWVTDQTLGDISLNINNKDIYFDEDGRFSFTVSPDFSNINIAGGFDAEPGYYLLGEFNGWDEDNMVPFVMRDGAITLNLEFCGDFLIKDRNGNWIGANIGGSNERFTFTADGNNVAITSAEDKKNFNVLLPSNYTLTINASGAMLFITGFPTEGYYIAGDFNEWKPELMTKHWDNSYSSIQDFGEHDKFKFLDYEGNWYGGNTESNGDTYNINNQWCTDIPLTKGNLGYNFIIDIGGTFKFILKEGDDGLKLTVVGLGFITLGDALEGISGVVEDELFVAAVHADQVYVTNGIDWVRLNGVFNANDLEPGYCVDLTQTIIDGFSGKGTSPTITINGWVTYYTDGPQIPNINEYTLDGDIAPMPKPCQVVKFTGWYYNRDGQSVLCAYGNNTGPSIDLSNADDLSDGTKYTILAGVEYKEPLAAGAPHRVNASGADVLDNLVANVLSAVGEEIYTGVVSNISDVDVVNVKYSNIAGQVSDQPFNGVNIVVTTYSDGSVRAVKVVK